MHLSLLSARFNRDRDALLQLAWQVRYEFALKVPHVECASNTVEYAAKTNKMQRRYQTYGVFSILDPLRVRDFDFSLSEEKSDLPCSQSSFRFLCSVLPA